MLILSRVCAEFHDKSGTPVFKVTPKTRLTFQEAPEAIRDDPLFAMLLNDRSIEVAENNARKKELENDPLPGGDPVQSPAPSPADPGTKKPAKKP